MDSLHPPCTPLKKAYDSCFNHWFEEYLAIAAPKPGSNPGSSLPLSSAGSSASSSASSLSSSSSASASSTPAASSSSASSLRSASSASNGSTLTMSSADTNADPVEVQDRQARIRAKAEEYEKKCGDTWRAYRTCLETGLREKDLKQLIQEAREEFPLKQPKEVNMDI